MGPLSKLACRLLLASLLVVGGGGPLRAQEESYTVAAGDTLGTIAARLGVTVAELAAANDIEDPNLIRVGQVLLAPGRSAAAVEPAGATVAVRAWPGDTVASLASRYGVEGGQAAALNGLPAAHRLFPGQPLQIPAQAAPPPTAVLGAVTSVQMPATLVQGRTGRLFVTSSRPVQLEGRWNGQPLIFQPLQDDGLRQAAFLPVDALLAPAAYPLEVGYTTSSGVPLRLQRSILVEAGPYDSQEIVVSQEKADVLIPPVVQAERERVVSVWSQVSPERFWLERFQRPISADYPTTSPFGIRRTYSVADVGNFHAGQDFGAPEGTLIFAPAPGRVVLAEPLAVRGNAVILDHGRGVFSGYWHLSEMKVSVGMEVAAGDVLGLVGNTGLSTGAHLHWELRIGGVAVDPMQFLEEAPFPLP